MSTKIDTIERDGLRLDVYDNGMERNAETGHIVTPPKTALITAENTYAFHRARLEKKRERALAGANAALRGLTGKDGKPIYVNPQDLDYVEAIAFAQTRQALMIGDTSSTKAAEFVMRHTGQDERQDAGADVAGALAAIAAVHNAASAQALVRVWRDVMAAQERRDTIDGQLHDTETGVDVE